MAVLSGLLLYGVGRLDFEVLPTNVVAILLSALAAQWVGTRLCRLPRFDPRSALISGLSLCLLLRTNLAGLAALAALVAVGSKFLIRWHGKHVFNPTNLGLVLGLLLTDRVWVSAGQWGSLAWFAFLMACLGSLVVFRAARADVTLAFLAFHGAVLFGRALWLGDPWAIPLKQIQSGALLLFAFFMISDPRTTPDSRAGRIVFALVVALGAGLVQFVLYRTNGLLWSLACCSILVPVLDRILPGSRYSWTRSAREQPPGPSEETKHETNDARPRRLGAPAPLPAGR